MTETATAEAPAAAPADLDALLRDALPPQGLWSDEEYLWLTDRCGRRVEFTDGRVEELPMPTDSHQAILGFLYLQLVAWLRPRGGVTQVSGLRVRLRAGKFREPDVTALRDRADPRRRDRYWLGADLVVEVVSPDRPARDLVEKRADYAEAGIPEYWIVDPRDETISVLALADGAYAARGAYGRGETARSTLLEGFRVDASAMFDAADAAD